MMEWDGMHSTRFRSIPSILMKSKQQNLNLFHSISSNSIPSIQTYPKAFELYETAPLHSQKYTHNYAFQRTYIICLLKGKTSSYHTYSFSPSTYILFYVSIIKYFNHSNSVFSSLNSRLNVNQVWVEFPLSMIN